MVSKKLGACVLVLVAAIAGNGWAQSSAQPLKQSLVVSEQVTLAGALNEEFMASLEGTGTLVIDLRTAPELGDEPAQLERLGVDYVNLPIGRSVQSVPEFSALLVAAGKRDVIVHCASGNRAGMLWAAHLIANGEELDDALQAVKPIVTKQPVEDAIVEFAKARL